MIWREGVTNGAILNSILIWGSCLRPTELACFNYCPEAVNLFRSIKDLHFGIGSLFSWSLEFSFQWTSNLKVTLKTPRAFTRFDWLFGITSSDQQRLTTYIRECFGLISPDDTPEKSVLMDYWVIMHIFDELWCLSSMMSKYMTQYS